MRIFGISFYSFGLYPFVRKLLVCTQNQIIDLYDFSRPLAEKLKLAVFDTTYTDRVVECIENMLYSELEVKAEDIRIKNLICDFIKYSDSMTITTFCKVNKYQNICA